MARYRIHTKAVFGHAASGGMESLVFPGSVVELPTLPACWVPLPAWAERVPDDTPLELTDRGSATQDRGAQLIAERVNSSAFTRVVEEAAAAAKAKGGTR